MKLKIYYGIWIEYDILYDNIINILVWDNICLFLYEIVYVLCGKDNYK